MIRTNLIVNIFIGSSLVGIYFNECFDVLFFVTHKHYFGHIHLSMSLRLADCDIHTVIWIEIAHLIRLNCLIGHAPIINCVDLHVLKEQV